MVHAIIILKCKNGHSNFLMSLDKNECGCHHNGDPCIIISCRDCVTKSFKNNTEMPKDLSIPMGKHTMEELEEFRQVNQRSNDGN